MITSLDDALALIRDGALLALPPEYGGVAMAATRSLVRRGVRGLRLVALPTSSLQADMLIGAGAVASAEIAAISLGEFGPAPRFTSAVTAGTLTVKDATCPALHAAFQASEKGVPFMPLRGIIGSDILRHRPDWLVVDNPFAEPAAEGPDRIVLLPAIRPDVALFHAAMADRDGNVWIGRRRELMTMAHASAATVVTVERLYDGNLLDDELLAAGTLPSLYVDRVAVVERGAWPLPFGDSYPADEAHLSEYVRLAATEEGFRRYLDEHVFDKQAA